MAPTKPVASSIGGSGTSIARLFGMGQSRSRTTFAAATSPAFAAASTDASTASASAAAIVSSAAESRERPPFGLPGPGLDHGDDPGEILTQGSRYGVRRPVRLDLIVFHTAVGMTNALDAVAADGRRDAISREALAGLSPYQTEHINRFGDYVLDLNQPPAPLPFALPPRSQPARQADAPAEAIRM